MGNFWIDLIPFILMAVGGYILGVWVMIRNMEEICNAIIQ